MSRRKDIEKVIASVFERHRVSTIPVPVAEIARSEGLKIVNVSMDADVSGALVRHGDTNVIAVNSKQSITRQRFTIAHELAHHLLGHQDEDHIDWNFTILRRDLASSEGTDNNEKEANFFAANLLMPKVSLLEDAREHIGYYAELEDEDALIAKLAAKYDVSTLAMRYRLTNLGVIDPF